MVNYTLGQPLTNANFSSFTYTSNLVSSGNLVSLSGVMGVWSVGTTRFADQGNSSIWALPGSTAPTVPTLGLPVMIGLAVMMALMGAFLLKGRPNRLNA